VDDTSPKLKEQFTRVTIVPVLLDRVFDSLLGEIIF
jgi:hypothetical protein